MTRTAYHREYYWRNVDRRRQSARRSQKERRIRAACRELGIPYGR